MCSWQGSQKGDFTPLALTFRPVELVHAVKPGEITEKIRTSPRLGA